MAVMIIVAMMTQMKVTVMVGNYHAIVRYLDLELSLSHDFLIYIHQTVYQHTQCILHNSHHVHVMSILIILDNNN